ncbi:hypothetical protein JCGZ_24052 [Jatropha curcas]|uniref:C2 domain-containing protein n=1 Tax=Jatropha curcas TaxID=180498 RepID=A0A067LHK9_JATCU|nr:uncharacterized protein LOC105649501 [Jatropha curcas]KDP46843.1 hypothetical protein JCGZ_24052 [Jatropha curcas]
MGLASQSPSSFSFEIEVLQAKNLELKSHGHLFVRYYLSSGNNKRIKLQTNEISSKSNLFWNESFSLECLGTEDSINSLKKESVVFELRWRNTTNSFLGKINGGSKLLGRAQIPMDTIFESPKMEMEKWVMMLSENKSCAVLDDDVKPPSVKIAMRVRGAEMVIKEQKKKKKKKRNGRLSDGCGCCKDSGCKCQDYEIFALVGAFEAL